MHIIGVPDEEPWNRKQAGVDGRVLRKSDDTMRGGAHIKYGGIKEIPSRGETLLGIVPL